MLGWDGIESDPPVAVYAPDDENESVFRMVQKQLPPLHKGLHDALSPAEVSCDSKSVQRQKWHEFGKSTPTLKSMLMSTSASVAVNETVPFGVVSVKLGEPAPEHTLESCGRKLPSSTQADSTSHVVPAKAPPHVPALVHALSIVAVRGIGAGTWARGVQLGPASTPPSFPPAPVRPPVTADPPARPPAPPPRPPEPPLVDASESPPVLVPESTATAARFVTSSSPQPNATRAPTPDAARTYAGPNFAMEPSIYRDFTRASSPGRKGPSLRGF